MQRAKGSVPKKQAMKLFNVLLQARVKQLRSLPDKRGILFSAGGPGMLGSVTVTLHVSEKSVYFQQGGVVVGRWGAQGVEWAWRAHEQGQWQQEQQQ